MTNNPAKILTTGQIFPKYGDFKSHIAHGKAWYYQNSPIRRLTPYRLLILILHRQENNEYWLTTPITLDQRPADTLPFIYLKIPRQNCIYYFKTNLDKQICLTNARLSDNTADLDTAPAYRHLYTSDGFCKHLNQSVFYQFGAPPLTP